MEAEVFEVVDESGLGEVVGHHLGTGGQRGLHPGLALQAQRTGFLRQQAGTHQHARVRGIGAGGDGGDDYRAVFQLIGLAAVGDGGRALRRTRSLLAFESLAEVGFHAGQQHAVLRALGAGQRGLDGGQIKMQHVGVFGFRRVRCPPHALRLRIGLHGGDRFFRATGEAQVVERLFVDREDAAGGAVFRAHVSDGVAVGGGQIG